MTSSDSRWRRLEALFYEALELKPEERADFLEKSCAGDADLRKEIQELLNSSDKPMDLLQESVVEAAQHVVANRRDVVAPGTQLAHYKVISMLGAGHAAGPQNRTQAALPLAHSRSAGAAPF
jgi:eukaryotic-like serine/threonine-protein kinase